MPDPEVRVCGFREKSPTTYSLLFRIAKRVDFFPGGKGFLVISPDGFQTLKGCITNLAKLESEK